MDLDWVLSVLARVPKNFARVQPHPALVPKLPVLAAVVAVVAVAAAVAAVVVAVVLALKVLVPTLPAVRLLAQTPEVVWF